jgi:N-succinyldiaminopimelate aminotransferase
MNPHLSQLQPYPFERLRQLFSSITPNPALRPISLGIGEPQHATPAFIQDALDAAVRSVPSGLAAYPATAGSVKLREAFAAWLQRRYGLTLNPATQMLPVNGSREALFALAQTLINPTSSARPPPGRPKAGDAPSAGSAAHEMASVGAPFVVCPNPFYQIYEGAAILAGARPWFVPAVAARNFAQDWDSVPEAVWANTQLLFVCSPGNPTGAVMPLAEWKKLFDLSDRYGFVIASDECYSEIYFRDDDKGGPPLGGLEAAAKLGRTDFKNLISFTSLSKRSNVPGLRSGFVAGDAAIIKQFLLYRTYHGSAMSPVVQSASAMAWADEAHVLDNRNQYRRKFAEVTPVLASVLDVALPDAGFYLWASAPGGDDVAFARDLYALYNVTVLPGSYLARDASTLTPLDTHQSKSQSRDQSTGNPGVGRIRMALVAETGECLEAAHRIVQFVQSRR